MAIFDDELMALKEHVLKLGLMVENAIRDSVKALVERDSDLAREVIKRDHLVNALDVRIDEECVRLIALRQPMARDLRLITTAMKITTDLERMGDLAANIAERALELNEEPQLKPFENIPKMADATQSMVRDTLDAFIVDQQDVFKDEHQSANLFDQVRIVGFQAFQYALFRRAVSQVEYGSRRFYAARLVEGLGNNIAEPVFQT